MLQLESLAFVIFCIINLLMVIVKWWGALSQDTFWEGFKIWIVGNFIQGGMLMAWLLLVGGAF